MKETYINGINQEINATMTLSELLKLHELDALIDLYNPETDKHATGTPDEIRKSFADYLGKEPMYIEFFDGGIEIDIK